MVFVCHRPAVWSSLKTVFEACNNDNNFNVVIVAIPNKKQLPDVGLNHEIYETEGAEEFFKNYPCRVINGYNYNTKEWFDLKSLRPDYLFFQTPYNICRPRQYSSEIVSKYAKLCYVHYATNSHNDTIALNGFPTNFLDNVTYLFTQDKYDHKRMCDHIRDNRLMCKCIMLGYPRRDGLNSLKNIDSDNWNFKKDKKIKRIIWTPRWTTRENNCCFFEFKDKLLEYVKQHNNSIDFIFRPHPQAFIEYVSNGDITKQDLDFYIDSYNNISNAKIDEQKEYLTTFYSSDILITDISSVIVDYYLTEKPIIYCHKNNQFNEFTKQLSTGFYWVNNWEELYNTLDMLIVENDPLKETRKKIIKNILYINPNGAGNCIKNYIKEKYYIY